jgi:hypothetical protein
VTIVRILLVSVLAAVGACGVASLILDGSVDRFSFIPLPFTLIGALLLLAPAMLL